MTTALERLKEDVRWVAWTYRRPRSANSKPTKPPINPHTGRVASVADPSTWGTFEQASERAARDSLPGVGYVLTSDDNITGGDLDRVRDASTGEIVGWAQDIVNYGETYCEISPSGTGLRFFWLGKLDRAVKNDAQQVELYGDSRYLTVTGKRIESCPDEICAAPRTLAALLARANVSSEAEPEPETEDEFSRLNTLALKNLSMWVPDLFPGKAKPSRLGYRVPSRLLGRDLEEDISITADGIVDFGVADQGDRSNGKRTPIGLIMEHKPASFDDAVGWLCEQLGVQRPGTVLDPQSPMSTARALMKGRFITEEGFPVLHRHRGAFWAWKNNCYKNVEDETLRTSIWRFLENARKRTPTGVLPYHPKRGGVSDILDALNAVCQLDPFIAVPTWLRDRDMPPATEFLSCANGLLHIPSGNVYPPTPDFFGVAATNVEFDENAPPPDAWLQYLDQVIGDADGIELLQDWMGYSLTPDTAQQKILLCYGQPRSGKGTYARIHTELLGEDSVSGPTMSSLGENFGLEPLITRPLAIVSDARIGGRTDKTIIVERLLSISGEDSLSVPRKFMSAWQGRLPTRFAIMTNELPAMSEGSGALAKRLLLLNFPNTFYGREDHRLESKLKTGMSGILNWSIDGYRRLRERGFFVQPVRGREELEQIEMLGAPVKAFLRDKCVVGPAHEVAVDTLYDKWKDWREAEGARDAGTKEWFGRNLHSAVPGLKVVTRGHARSLGRFYIGVGLNVAAAAEHDPPF